MKKQIWIPILVVVVIVVGVLIYSSQRSSTPQEKGVIKIGFIGPLSGEAASYGEAWRKALELAKEKIENNFKVKLEIIYEDDQFLPANAVTSIQKLINIDNVKAVIIGTSGETLAVAPIAEQNKILLMSVASSPDISKAGDYVFRVYPSDILQGNDLAQLAIKEGYKKVAVLSLENDYGTSLTNVFRNKIKESGGDVMTVENFMPQGTTDFKTQLTKIKGTGAEAIMIIAYENQYPLILKQMKELNIDLPILSAEAMYSPRAIQGVEEIAEGSLITHYAEPETEEYKKFIELHKTKYNIEPGPYAAGFYDNIMLVSEALIKNKGNIEKAKEWLYNVKGWKGATGITTFDGNGDVVGKNYSVYIIKNGQFVPYEQ